MARQFQAAPEGITKQQYYEQAVLLNEALVIALEAAGMALDRIDWDNYPTSRKEVVKMLITARETLDEAEKRVI